MPISGNLLTTAMAVMPHTDIDRALDTAMSMDIPFWPQRPNYSYYEDMYVQAAEHLPGILLNMEKRTLRFSMEKFIHEFDEVLAHFDNPEYFDTSRTYSVLYHRCLSLDFNQPPRNPRATGRSDQFRFYSECQNNVLYGRRIISFKPAKTRQ